MPHAALAWPLMLAALLLAPGVLAPAPLPDRSRPAQPGTTAAADASPEPERIVRRVRVPVGPGGPPAGRDAPDATSDAGSGGRPAPLVVSTSKEGPRFGMVPSGGRATVEEVDGTAGKVVVTVERRQSRRPFKSTLEITVTHPDRLDGPGSGVSYDGVVHAIKGQDNPEGAERKDETFTYRIEPAECSPICDSSSEREKVRIYVYLHGTVTTGDQQAAGSYAGDILVEATYEEPSPIE